MKDWLERLEKIRNNYVVAGAIFGGEYVVPICELDCLINDAKANPLDALVGEKIVEAYKKGKNDAIDEIIKQLATYLQKGSIDFMCVNIEGIEKRLKARLSNFTA